MTENSYLHNSIQNFPFQCCDVNNSSELSVAISCKGWYPFKNTIQILFIIQKNKYKNAKDKSHVQQVSLHVLGCRINLKIINNWKQKKHF